MFIHFPGYQFSGSFYTYSPTESHPVAVDPNMRSAEAVAISGKESLVISHTLCTVEIKDSSQCGLLVKETQFLSGG